VARTPGPGAQFYRSPVNQGYIYFLDGFTFVRKDLDGSGALQALFKLPSSFESLGGLTVSGSYIYWNESWNGPPPSDSLITAIGRANLDGTDVDEKFIVGSGTPGGVTVSGGYIYWANRNSTGSIGRADLDGRDVDQNFITGLSYPGPVVVGGGHIFWSGGASSATASIGRADLDGAFVEHDFLTGLGFTSIAAGPKFIYWANYDGNAIGRARVDGKTVDRSFITGLEGPNGLALGGGHLYWVNNEGDSARTSVARASVNGSGLDLDFIRGVPDSGPCAVYTGAPPATPKTSAPTTVATSTTTTTPATTSTTGAGVAKVSVTANTPSTFAFTLSTSGQTGVSSESGVKLKVSPGEVTFEVTNPADVILSHDFKVCSTPLTPAEAAEAWDNLPNNCTGTQTPVLAPGAKSAVLVVDFTTPGSYEYLSTVPDDASDGMKGELLVT